ncbi:hypothetical protein H5T89_04850 [bacterium]|nr:hypothetical protein [bacterium]
MERTEKVLEEVYKVLGIAFTPKIIDIPIHSTEINSLDVNLVTRISKYEIGKISNPVVEVTVALDTEGKIKRKIIDIPIFFLVNIVTDLVIINSIFIKRYPNSWRNLPEETKVKLLTEIKAKWPQYLEGIKIIGVYNDIPIGRVKSIRVDERTGILSFNLKEESVEENRVNLLVFKFLKDETLRSIAF